MTRLDSQVGSGAGRVRSDSEVIRIDHQLANVRALLEGFESSFRAGLGLSESAQSVLMAAGRLVDHACRLDAYRFAEADAARTPHACECRGRGSR